MSACKVSVVLGEASESEDDELEQSTENSLAAMMKQCVVVTGEASESDDDDEDNSVDSSVSGKEETPVKEVKSHKNESPDHRVLKKSRQTLLHKKLRERNVSLRSNIVKAATTPYIRATESIHDCTKQFVKSQIYIQDVSNAMKMLSNDLFHLEDKLDLVRNCNILPNIKVDVS